MEKGKDRKRMVPKPIILMGPPGIGKTAVAKKWIPDAEIVIVEDLCTCLPEDLRGLPFPSEDHTYTMWLPPYWLNRLSRKELGDDTSAVLVLDDIATALTTVQTATYALLLERKIGEIELGDGVQIIMTANKKEDRSAARVLPAALINRCRVIEFENKFDDWVKWYFEENPQFPLQITAFLEKCKPDLFLVTPAEMSVGENEGRKYNDKLGRYPTPRSWHFCAQVILEKILDGGFDWGDDSDAERGSGDVFDTVLGYIGEPAAHEFAAFCRSWGYFANLNLGKILNDPEKNLLKKDIPSDTDVDRFIALLGALTSYISGKLNDGKIICPHCEKSVIIRNNKCNACNKKIVLTDKDKIREREKIFEVYDYICGDNDEYAAWSFKSLLDMVIEEVMVDLLDGCMLVSKSPIVKKYKKFLVDLSKSESV